MKHLITLFMTLFSISSVNAQESIYEISINDITGNPIDLSQFKGKYMLFVNVASNCGFTSQYNGLESLYKKFKNDLIIIGSPCNQFGGQEPGTAKDIQEFCSKNYGVSFLITEKINVKGNSKHPLYNWLTEKNRNGVSSSYVKWNFQKYIVDRSGKFIDFFNSTTKPLSPKITSIIEQ